MDLNFSQLGLSLVAGSLTTLSPCVFPLLPMVLGGATQGNRWSPVFMGLGMAVSFALIGVVLGWAGPALGLDTEHVRTAGAALLVAFGLVMWVPALNEAFARWMQPLASRAHQTSALLDGRSVLSAFFLGGVLGLVWSPCSGPLLASALTLAASEGGAAKGALALGIFGTGAALPLVAVAYASRRGFEVARGRVMAMIDKLKKAFGLLIALTGLAILSGADKWLEAQIVMRLPDAWVRVTTLF